MKIQEDKNITKDFSKEYDLQRSPLNRSQQGSSPKDIEIARLRQENEQYKTRVSELLDKISELETLNTVNSAEATNNRATLTVEDGAERKENEKLQIQIRELGSVISNMLDDLNL